jgi:Rrf2 family protein
MVSARVHYATQALIELAIRRDDPSPVTIRDITDRHGVPGPFLTQILRTLRSVGWVRSIRGSQGGYRLAIPPSEITLLDIAQTVAGFENTIPCEADDSTSGETLQSVWADASQAAKAILAKQTLEQVAERVRDGNSAMYFI